MSEDFNPLKDANVAASLLKKYGLVFFRICMFVFMFGSVILANKFLTVEKYSEDRLNDSIRAEVQRKQDLELRQKEAKDSLNAYTELVKQIGELNFALRLMATQNKALDDHEARLRQLEQRK